MCARAHAAILKMANLLTLGQEQAMLPVARQSIHEGDGADLLPSENRAKKLFSFKAIEDTLRKPL